MTSRGSHPMSASVTPAPTTYVSGNHSPMTSAYYHDGALCQAVSLDTSQAGRPSTRPTVMGARTPRYPRRRILPSLLSPATPERTPAPHPAGRHSASTPPVCGVSRQGAARARYGGPRAHSQSGPSGIPALSAHPQRPCHSGRGARLRELNGRKHPMSGNSGATPGR